MLSSTLLRFISLPLLANAHFHLLYPNPRSSVDDTEPTGPCGGFLVDSNRTTVSSTAFPVALEMGHDRTVIQMLLAIGNNPGDNFNITLEQSFQQQGEGDFCLPDVPIPSDLNITDGTNATLQVVTDGEGGGGLYMCADITFSTSTALPPPSSCRNGTGITAFPLATPINANQSNADGSPQSGSSGSGSGSGSSSSSASGTAGGASPSTTPNEAAALMTAGWGLMGAAVLGGLTFL